MLADTGLAHEFKSDDFVVIKARASASVADSWQELDEQRRKGVTLAQMQETAEGDEKDDTVESEELDETLELEAQVVTGSRLQGGDLTARIFSYSAEDIATRGVSNLEEFFRTLPWAFSSVTTQTNMYNTPGDNPGNLALGVSTVNLRAMGSANTLVLVNGRRVAGKAGSEEDFANLMHVPLSAIERVEIQLDGASAVYGSDAIGGVVNFITKKNYRGLSASARRDYSSNDADKTRFELQGGYAWGNGNATLIVSRDKSEPITNSKAGWSTSDFRDLFGPEYDQRRQDVGQPGVVCEWLYPNPFLPPGLVLPVTTQCSFLDRTRYQLPSGHTGLDAGIDDFKVNDITPFDEIRPQNGEDSTNTSVTLNLEQYITDSLRVFADIQYSKHEAFQDFGYQLGAYIVPASNAYNPFGRAVIVNYAPVAEIKSGRIPSPYTTSDSELRTVTAGFIWEFGDGHELNFHVSRSKAERSAWRLLGQYQRQRWDPSAEGFYAALASPDPGRAFNLFGNGESQGEAFEEFLTTAFGPLEGTTDSRSFDATFSGNLFEMWGGAVEYSAGAEFRKNRIWQRTTDYVRGGADGPRVETAASRLGVEQPSREIAAYYAELAFPFIGRLNARPALESLILTLQARRDEYTTYGADGGGEFGCEQFEQFTFVPDQGWVAISFPGYDCGLRTGNVKLAENKHSATSPRVGFRYKPTVGFTLRGAWSRSFRPPVWNDQFNAQGPREFTSYYFDPFDPDGPLTEPIPIRTVFSNYSRELEPEYSDNFSFGFNWSPETMPGLSWTVDWSRVDFTNRIELSGTLFNYPEIAWKLPELVERNQRGDAITVYSRPLNIAEKISEIVETRLEYSFDTRLGNFTPSINYTRVLDEFFQASSDTPRISDVGTQNGSDDYTLQGALSWYKDRMSADLFIYHTPAYMNNRALQCFGDKFRIGQCDVWGKVLSLDVGSLTTVDLTVTYQFDNGLRVRAGGSNIFDRKPPTTLYSLSLPYDPTRWDARGQVLFLELKWEIF